MAVDSADQPKMRMSDVKVVPVLYVFTVFWLLERVLCVDLEC